MKSVPFCFHLSSVACRECGSAIRVQYDLCLVCLLCQGIGVGGTSVRRANDERLAELLLEMDGLARCLSADIRKDSHL